jgi:lipoprotein-releasing system permease protein
LRLPLFIAWRYLKSKKSHNVINIISGVSVAGVTIGTMALVIVLSVFNGFESLVISLFNTFDPEIKVMPARGKTFSPDTYPWDKIAGIPGVRAQTGTIEEKVLLRYGNNQYLATLKGVDHNYETWTGLSSMMLEFKGQPLAIPGQGVAYYLGLNLDNFQREIEVYAPRRKGAIGVNPEQAFNRMDIRPAGIFSIQQDFDSKYMIVPISFAREVLGYKGELSSVEIALNEGTDMVKVQSGIRQLLGNNFEVKNRFEQQEVLYRIMRTEKWAIFMILGFILFIATFNVIGSLSMLIIDKRKDIAVLYSMGADHKLIRKIFLTEGMMVSFSGAITGMILGALVCLIQQQFGLVKINTEGGSFLIEAYPVLMQAMDFLYIFLIVSAIGIIAAWLPVRNAGRTGSLPATLHSR